MPQKMTSEQKNAEIKAWGERMMQKARERREAPLKMAPKPLPKPKWEADPGDHITAAMIEQGLDPDDPKTLELFERGLKNLSEGMLAGIFGGTLRKERA